jgi:hypothetical protein
MSSIREFISLCIGQEKEKQSSPKVPQDQLQNGVIYLKTNHRLDMTNSSSPDEGIVGGTSKRFNRNQEAPKGLFF